MRELRNTLERAVLLLENERIDARSRARFIGEGRGQIKAEDDAHGEPIAAAPDRANAQQYDEVMQDFARRFLADALRAANGHVANAAARIGMARATLYRRIVALGIGV
ncbi:hypothetical protein LMG28688_05333 [Paraburkholderia caffeinitolerans]|uniref:DNA binding HTH domain-containing protein n=1 Tax=Paraburkholderia caffeinitolerans TaxID=1723730 RepID=A0A6J5GIG7_9BURK|nr:helix-turn-helix domain-containing protein [Paraburkholderia caffeinitolerans]CAB3801352.1 hypothetical protein LMG28688_05333 [Paraburkholderia caffeinitolerans]